MSWRAKKETDTRQQAYACWLFKSLRGFTQVAALKALCTEYPATRG